MSLSAINACDINLTLQWSVSKTITGLTNGVSSAENIQAALSFVLGTGAAAINEIYAETRTLVGGADETLDLAAALANVVNESNITVARVKAMLIRHLSTDQDSTNGGSSTGITIGDAASNPAEMFLGGTSPTITLGNGAFILWADPTATGEAITNSSSDQLKITNDDGSNTAGYQIVLFLADA